MKWFCCGHTRKENYCPECGSESWDTDDEIASASLVEMLVERNRNIGRSETYKEKVDKWQNKLEKLPLEMLDEAEDFHNRSQIWAGQEKLNDKQKIKRYISHKLSCARGNYESAIKRANKFDRWANSLYRNLFNTKVRI